MDIYLARSLIPNAGRGVFAGRNFRSGDLIETCPLLILPSSDREAIDAFSMQLYNYYFAWENDAAAIALGHGSLYNHSYHPNALYETRFDEQELLVRAHTKISAGDEITINYNGLPDDQTLVWFDAR